MSAEEAQPLDPTYVVGARGLLLGDRVYDKGEIVSAREVGKHLLMLVRSGQLLPTDPHSPIEKRRRKTKLEKIFGRLKR